MKDSFVMLLGTGLYNMSFDDFLYSILLNGSLPEVGKNWKTPCTFDVSSQDVESTSFHQMYLL